MGVIISILKLRKLNALVDQLSEPLRKLTALVDHLVNHCECLGQMSDAQGCRKTVAEPGFELS